jgi:hypothetical protein
MEEVVDDSDRFSNAVLVEIPICCVELCTLFLGLLVIAFLAAPTTSTDSIVCRMICERLLQLLQ